MGKCAFCFEGNKTENNLRLRSVSSVIDEIDYIVSNLGDRRCFTFLDDTFILNSQRTEAICRHLIDKYNGEIGWFCEARVDILMKNIHLLPLLKRAGLLRIQLGGESGSQRVLDVYNKNMRTEELLECVKEIYKAGIPSIYVNFIIGGAYESLKTFNDTLVFAKSLIDAAPGCVEVGASLFVPYVGTPMRNTPSVYGVNLIDKDVLRGPDGFVVTADTDYLSEQKIYQLKSVFDRDISKKMSEVLYGLDDNTLLKHYMLARDYLMTTQYYMKSETIESYTHYFKSIVNYGFVSIKDLTVEELSLYIPYRTMQPISDGEEYYRIVDGKCIKGSRLENAVFFLSSGKLCFCEIVQVLSKSNDFENLPDLEETVCEIYRRFDEERLVVWKKDL